MLSTTADRYGDVWQRLRATGAIAVFKFRQKTLSPGSSDATLLARGDFRLTHVIYAIYLSSNGLALGAVAESGALAE
ncbi:MAG: hypothetical protein IRY93_07225 [Chthoniobacterales bacterium]|nr:hypothetical protein [Chthoniobacterales bacterium]